MEKLKNKIKITIKLLSLLVFLLIILLISIYFCCRIQEIEKDLEICKERGYDGIKFRNQFSTEVICSNFEDNDPNHQDFGNEIKGEKLK